MTVPVIIAMQYGRCFEKFNLIFIFRIFECILRDISWITRIRFFHCMNFFGNQYYLFAVLDKLLP